MKVAFKLRVSIDHVGLNAIWVLLLTGCRKSEITQLRWAEVDVEHSCLRLADSKTGQQIRPIGQAALEIIGRQPRYDDHSYVFPAVRGNGFCQSLPKLWNRIREELGFSEITMHTFRHAFASVAAELGYSEFTIGGILGHKPHSITSRYVHLVDRSLVDAANAVSAEVKHKLVD